MDLLRNKISTDNVNSSDLKLIPTIIKNEKTNIKNQRPKDYLEERETYEQLCRQNGSKVNENFNEKFRFFILNLVKCKT